jgi:hypothetical protein
MKKITLILPSRKEIEIELPIKPAIGDSISIKHYPDRKPSYFADYKILDVKRHFTIISGEVETNIIAYVEDKLHYV